MKFPEDARLTPEAKDLICKLLCSVEHRLGADQIKVCYYFLLSHAVYVLPNNHSSTIFFYQSPDVSSVECQKFNACGTNMKVPYITNATQYSQNISYIYSFQGHLQEEIYFTKVFDIFKLNFSSLIFIGVS